MAARFSKEDAKGDCPVTGNAAAAQVRFDTAFSDLLTAVGAAMVTTDSERVCAISQLKTGRTHLQCLMRALKGQLLRPERFTPITLGNLVSDNLCSSRYLDRIGELDSASGCVSTVPTDFRNTVRRAALGLAGADLTDAIFSTIHIDGADLSGVQLTSGGLSGGAMTKFTGANLSNSGSNGFEWNGADLSGANLTNFNFTGLTDLTGADLNGANVTGAVLGVIWSHTRCPDGTFSDLNGSSPESCCANLAGFIPSGCVP